MQEEVILELFQRGLIPGPHESEEDFLQRVQARPPRPEWKEIPPLPAEWKFSVDWVPLIYSKSKLRPWEGALFSMQEGSCCIQLHPKLRTQKLLGYSKTDILHHESIHAAREMFQEPQFEEILAYSTSNSRWRRWLGPLFERSWELPLLLGSLFFVPYTLPVPLFFLYRLFFKQRLFLRLKKKLPLAILVCLTDQEIRDFSKPRAAYVADNTLRGQLIKALFAEK